MESEKKDQFTYSTATVSEAKGPPIPAGHERFYCEKCQQSYDLPNGATSW
eukprot:CAMPEP_0197233460 /NCGR_PEP_ID=MMETSP1429-20130617/1513_1 /TAXON_ID=49237 /ORGANISM="Chaetoceros  sp., Strain UNC1202" /LENGTH=49 /DNA_ID= /DNA_START= /DNA_END= /DNA_ORIENTATION=